MSLMAESSVQIPREKIRLELLGKRFLKIVAVDRRFFRVIEMINNGRNNRKNIAPIVKNKAFRGKIKVNTKRGMIPERWRKKILLKKVKGNVKRRVNFIL